jgi:membrane protease YdiL (CAAX protease family)
MREPPAGAPELSPQLFWVVVSSTAGLFIAFSLVRLLLEKRTENVMTDWRLLGVLSLESIMALFWVPYLARRGWTMRHVTHRAAPRDLVVGAGLAVAAYLAYWLLFTTAAAAIPDYARTASDMRIGGSVSPWVVLLVSVANLVAEEFLYLGFVANALRKQGLGIALSASVVARVLVHLYQGPMALLASLPIGVTLAAYYLVSSRIWPAVVAHGIMDLIALSRLMR